MEFDDADFEVILLNNIKLYFRWFVAGLIAPVAIGALQNVVSNAFFNAGPLGIISWFAVPAAVGLSTVISLFIVRKKSLSLHQILWDFLRIFFPSVLAFILFIVLIGGLTVERSQYGISNPLIADLLWIPAGAIASILGIFLVHMARGETFIEAVKQTFQRLRKDPIWTIGASILVLLMWILIGYLLNPIKSDFIGFFALNFYSSLWVVVLEYIDTRRIRSWRAKFK